MVDLSETVCKIFGLGSIYFQLAVVEGFSVNSVGRFRALLAENCYMFVEMFFLVSCLVPHRKHTVWHLFCTLIVLLFSDS